MGDFKIVLLPPDVQEHWPDMIRARVPGAQVLVFDGPEEALHDLEDADGAYGYMPPEVFSRARRLSWIQAPAAAPHPSFFHDALVESDVTVTNFRGIYHDSVGHHAVALLLALARRFHTYLPQQLAHDWKPAEPAVHLPDSTVLVVGLGGIGAEVARICKALGMTVAAVDPRRTERPGYVDDLRRPEAVGELLPKDDFVVVTTPDTPQTRGMFNSSLFALMKPAAFLVNVGRGACVVLDDLVEALRSGAIAGAALDVFEIEPLPANHPLWKMPNVLITPHIAALDAPHLLERRTEIFIDNCGRFADGQPLRNVVDKANRY